MLKMQFPTYIKMVIFLLVFSFSAFAEEVSQVRHDLVGGTITGGDISKQTIIVKSKDGSSVKAIISPPDDTWIHYIRNSVTTGDAAKVPSLEELITDWRDRQLLAHGLRYEGDGENLYAKEIILFTDAEGNVLFEDQNWWRTQATALADFWLKAQGLNNVSADGRVVDGAGYRTEITKVGTQRTCQPDDRSSCLQETATLSRLIYGLSSTYIMTGEQRFFDAVKVLVEYQRKNMRVKLGKDFVYWIHALNGPERIVGSLFNEDTNTIPLYEQIYCLAGLVQYYRITGDAEVLDDIKKSIAFMDHYYRDEKKLGYYSHISPDPFIDAGAPPDRDEALDKVAEFNRRNKNWNSIGDHLPAYMLNLYLGTGDEAYLNRLDQLTNLIIEHFPKSDSPFVAERFDQDWNPELDYSWQQNRAVVGHNLKIVWSLGQMYFMKENGEFRETAERIADLMLRYGEDQLRGGWYDVIERHIDPESGRYLNVWHNRKAWWQQEQGILANYITYVYSHDPRYLESARRGAGFYNHAFLDRSDGGTFFDTMADGIPYLTGDRADKGSHSKSGYHSLELAYYANAYTNLLIHRRPITLYFKQAPSRHSRVLRIQPVALPNECSEIESVVVNGKAFYQYDKKTLTVDLPPSESYINVSVVLAPRDVRVGLAPGDTSPEGGEMSKNNELPLGAVLPEFSARELESSSILSAQALGTVNSHRLRWSHHSKLNNMKGDAEDGFYRDYILFPKGGKNGDGIYAVRFTVNHDASRTYKVAGEEHKENRLLRTGDSAITARNVIFQVTKGGKYRITFDPLNSNFEIDPAVHILNKIKSMQLNGFVYDDEHGVYESYNRHRSFPVQKWDSSQFSHQMKLDSDGVWSKKIYLKTNGGMDHRKDGVYQFLFSANQNTDWGFCAINDSPYQLSEGCGYSSKSGMVMDSDIVIKVVEDGWYTVRVKPDEHRYSIEPNVEILNHVDSFQLNGTVHQADPWNPSDPTHQMSPVDKDTWRVSLPLSADGGLNGSGAYAINLSINQEWMLDSLGFGAWINGNQNATEIATWHNKPQEPNIVFKVIDSGIYTFSFHPGKGILNISPRVQPIAGIKDLRLVGDVYKNESDQWNPSSAVTLMESDDGILFKKLINLDAYKTYSYKYTVNNLGFLWAFSDYPFDGYLELATHGDPAPLEYTPMHTGPHLFEANILTGEYRISDVNL